MEWRIGSSLWVTQDQYEAYLLRGLLDTEQSAVRYQDVMLGIERRWGALMKRRNEPKRKAWQVEVIGDMPNN